ncbi:hypothetical protein [Clostridium sp. 1xD42-85]|uniref:hypothetical protein n=1 Tax=Clostridium sp. 1xD42-85 TaxID=2320084 RepID=UPI0011C22169|nr:hypothetical protein [Clostridium sp. 1xD42-85]
MSEVLGVWKSGYYDWRNRDKSEQKKRREKLTAEVKRVYMESKRRYGSPKITEIKTGGLGYITKDCDSYHER